MKKVFILILLIFFSYEIFSQDTSSLSKFIDNWIGKPYRYGGESEKGIDCSAFVRRLYKDVYNILIPRTCFYQQKMALIVNLQDIKIGDIIFFKSKTSPSGSHCGVYIGNDKFIHSANYRDGVKISCIFDYSRLIRGVGRF